MLKKLGIKNFTAFRQANLEFCDGLNVIVGENGSGKTHLLKLGYLLSKIWDAQVKNKSSISKEAIERYISERLQNIFKPDKIGNLSRSDSDGKTEVTGVVEGSIPTVSITVQGEQPLPPVEDDIEWEFRFSDRAETKVAFDKEKKVTIDKLDRLTSNAQYGGSVYIPSKEMISFFDGFLSIYDKYELQFDETFKDLGLQLSSPKLKETPRLLSDLLVELGQAIGGKVILKGGRFYIDSGNKTKNREITLLAEGLRKLATITQLIENGSLQSGGTLFWDEPEANLNPRLIRLVAKALINLGNNGVQVIIATHSLFLLRELDILLHDKQQVIESRFFGLNITENGSMIEQGCAVDDIGDITSLDESLMQSDRYLEMGE